jgi:NTE family protein
MDKRNPLNPDHLPIVLLLQGGGALGAYQAGVYHALHEHGLAPRWVVGTSIGAINGTLIAGNEPAMRVGRLKAFWDRVAHPDQLNMDKISDAQRRLQIHLNTIDTVLNGVPGLFRPRWFNPFAYGMEVAPECASFYDTRPLEDTMRELVDFDYLNSRAAMRLTMTAVGVTTGLLAHFDSAHGRLGPEHVRASCSLPPGFGPVRIEGQLYWDGGLYSNTPLESVLADLPPGNTLCFMVDLWSASGAEPLTLDEVRTRQKDVTFASRTQRHIADYIKTHRLQRKLRELYARMPPHERSSDDVREMDALGCDGTVHIVRLRYAGQDWHMASKDINFSKGSIEWRWDQGYGDAQRALLNAGWLRQVATGASVVLHELPGHDVSARQAD